jgi:hypothetical protein
MEKAVCDFRALQCAQHHHLQSIVRARRVRKRELLNGPDRTPMETLVVEEPAPAPDTETIDFSVLSVRQTLRGRCAQTKSAGAARRRVDHPRSDAVYRHQSSTNWADLMQTAPADVESAIARITQNGARCRHSYDHRHANAACRCDLTGVIKANVPLSDRFPGRFDHSIRGSSSMRTAPNDCSARVTCSIGPPGTGRMIRAQGVLVTDDEIRRVVDHAAKQSEPNFENLHSRTAAIPAP